MTERPVIFSSRGLDLCRHPVHWLDLLDPAVAAERHAAQLRGLPDFERFFEMGAGGLAERRSARSSES